MSRTGHSRRGVGRRGHRCCRVTLERVSVRSEATRLRWEAAAVSARHGRSEAFEAPISWRLILVFSVSRDVRGRFITRVTQRRAVPQQGRQVFRGVGCIVAHERTQAVARALGGRQHCVHVDSEGTETLLRGIPLGHHEGQLLAEHFGARLGHFQSLFQPTRGRGFASVGAISRARYWRVGDTLRVKSRSFTVSYCGKMVGVFGERRGCTTV
jgi:hypothetical protein